MKNDRPLPHNLEIEKNILASCLMGPEYLNNCDAASVTPQMFYSVTHQTIYSAISEIKSRKHVPDMLTVSDLLKRNGKLDTVGGDIYLAEICNGFVSGAAINAWLDVFLRDYSARTFIRTSEKCVERLYSGESFEAVSQSGKDIIRRNLGLIERKKPICMKALSDKANRMVYDMNQNPDRYVVRYCIPGIDERLSHARTQLHILAAMPGAGKTGFALSSMAAQMDNGIKHVLFCNETPSDYIMVRYFSIVAGIEYKATFNLKGYPELTTKKYVEAVKHVNANSNFRIFGKGDYKHSPDGIARELDKLEDDKYFADMVSVDYLQTLECDDRNISSPFQKVENNIYEINRIFTKHNVAGLVLSQLNRDKQRDTTARNGILADLKGSSAIEQEGDYVTFLQKENPEDKKGVFNVKWYSAKVRGPEGIDTLLKFDSGNGKVLGVRGQYE